MRRYGAHSGVLSVYGADQCYRGHSHLSVHYNDFLLPLIMISNPEQYKLPLVQYVFQGQFNTDFNLAFASHEKKTGLSQKGTLK